MRIRGNFVIKYTINHLPFFRIGFGCGTGVYGTGIAAVCAGIGLVAGAAQALKPAMHSVVGSKFFNLLILR